jgi:hypothetical protein
VPSGAQADTQDSVSPPPLPAKRVVGSQATRNSQANLNRRDPGNTGVQEVGQPTGTRPKTRPEPIKRTSQTTGRVTKPTLPAKGFTRTPPTASGHIPQKSGGSGRMDERMEFSPGEAGREEKARLVKVGDTGKPKPVSPMAAMRSNTQFPLTKTAPATNPPRSKSSQLTRQEQEAQDRARGQPPPKRRPPTTTTQKEGPQPTVSRPTRSNTVAPEIKTSATPLERELAKAKKTAKSEDKSEMYELD